MGCIPRMQFGCAGGSSAPPLQRVAAYSSVSSLLRVRYDAQKCVPPWRRSAMMYSLYFVFRGLHRCCLLFWEGTILPLGASGCHAWKADQRGEQHAPCAHRASFFIWILYLTPLFYFAVAPLRGMPCTQCARSAKFWMSANTRTLVLAPFHKFLVPYQGFFGFPSI